MDGVIEVGYVIGVVFVAWFTWNQDDEHTLGWWIGAVAGAVFWPIILIWVFIIERVFGMNKS